VADTRYPDADLGRKRPTQGLPEVADESYQLPVYRGENVRKKKTPKDVPVRSPQAEALRRRIDLASSDE
jgi:hypothetical protein